MVLGWIGVEGLGREQRRGLLERVLEGFGGWREEEAALVAAGLVVECVEAQRIKTLLQHPNARYFWEVFLARLNQLTPSQVQKYFQVFEMALEYEKALLPASDLSMAFSILIRHMLSAQDALAQEILCFVERECKDPAVLRLLEEAVRERWGS
jgi:hypothetical protein